MRSLLPCPLFSASESIPESSLLDEMLTPTLGQMAVPMEIKYSIGQSESCAHTAIVIGNRYTMLMLLLLISFTCVHNLNQEQFGHRNKFPLISILIKVSIIHQKYQEYTYMLRGTSE